MSNKNITILGAGLGGLITGAILAKEGHQVTLVEKNHHVGGGLQSYKRFGTIFDTDMHLFGGMKPDGNIRKICDYLGIVDQFKVKNLDDSRNVDIYVDEEQKSYYVNLCKEGFVESFSAYFPNQADNLEQYLKAVNHIMDHFDLFYLRPKRRPLYEYTDDFKMPANVFIAKYVNDKKLQSLLAIVNLLYAGEADVTPAFLHAAISTIFLNGACRVAGGYSTFADALADCINKHGGKIIIDCPINEIVTENRMVKSIKADKFSIPCDCLISAIPPKTMVSLLNNRKALSNAYQTLVFEKKDSLSAFIINIKLKKDTLKFSNRIGFFLKHYDSVWKAYTGGDIEKFLYMTPPSHNQDEYAETLNIIVPMEWSLVKKWEDTKQGHRTNDYFAFKTSVYEAVMKELSKIVPNIQDMVDKADTATPLTIRDYTGVGSGAMCGGRKDCNSTLQFLPVATRIPNLFITGQNVFMHGFCGVTLTAIQTCEAILGEDYIVNKLNNIK